MEHAVRMVHGPKCALHGLCIGRRAFHRLTDLAIECKEGEEGMAVGLDMPSAGIA